MSAHFPRIASLRGVEGLRDRVSQLGLELPCEGEILAAPVSPLAAPLPLGVMGGVPRIAANRFVIQPMEGWDGTPDGRPSELTTRRWQNFGASGAGLIWGGEAVAVRADGRANPLQLLMTTATAAAIGELRTALVRAACSRGGVDAHLVPIIGLQLTHSGRWSRSAPAVRSPRVAFRHPLLDPRSGVADDAAVLSDAEVRALITCFAEAAYLAQEEGFDFVDLKHCHGYLLHEFLAARTRSGAYGGPTLGARAHLLQELIAAVRVAAPRVGIGVRLSVFDSVPYASQATLPDGRPGVGVAATPALPYQHAFGADPWAPGRWDLTESLDLARQLAAWGVTMLNVTGGSPYYTPHLQRPAAFPPSDGYAPPEDPLAGVCRLLDAARAVRTAVPAMVVVSSGWSYLQDYVPHVAQACVRAGWFDAVGLGRMALAYPTLPADVLTGRALDRRRICRTFSDCTTAPRNGLVSGCYPLDPFYRTRPEWQQLKHLRAAQRNIQTAAAEEHGRPAEP